MKKILILITGLLLLSMPAFADNVGYLDMDRILSRYKDAQKIQEQIQKKREEYLKLVDEKQKKIEEARSKNKKDSEIQDLIKKFKTELQPKEEEMAKHEGEQQRSLLSKILDAADKVKGQYGIDVVVDKRVVYLGGFDLSDFVLEKLNK